MMPWYYWLLVGVVIGVVFNMLLRKIAAECEMRRRRKILLKRIKEA